MRTTYIYEGKIELLGSIFLPMDQRSIDLLERSAINFNKARPFKEVLNDFCEASCPAQKKSGQSR
jgi:hypothetical protein